MKRGLGVAGALIAIALLLGIVGFAVDVLRWVLIIAAIVLVVGVVTGFVGGRRSDA